MPGTYYFGEAEVKRIAAAVRYVEQQQQRRSFRQHRFTRDIREFWQAITKEYIPPGGKGEITLYHWDEDSEEYVAVDYFEDPVIGHDWIGQCQGIEKNTRIYCGYQPQSDEYLILAVGCEAESSSSSTETSSTATSSTESTSSSDTSTDTDTDTGTGDTGTGDTGTGDSGTGSGTGDGTGSGTGTGTGTGTGDGTGGSGTTSSSSGSSSTVSSTGPAQPCGCLWRWNGSDWTLVSGNCGMTLPNGTQCEGTCGTDAKPGYPGDPDEYVWGVCFTDPGGVGGS